ncbi:MAG: hypothetical protein R3281_06680 [Balneolaceae bacterium]|nr:hypothetical protein [Balneolaceae bacterium]
MATPPAQDYPSTHSALGNSAGTILTELVGDQVSFTTVTTTLDEMQTSRSFDSYLDAASENAESRILGGFHFRFSCDAGLELGTDVAGSTLQTILQPKQ